MNRERGMEEVWGTAWPRCWGCPPFSCLFLILVFRFVVSFLFFSFTGGIGIVNAYVDVKPGVPFYLHQPRQMFILLVFSFFGFFMSVFLLFLFWSFLFWFRTVFDTIVYIPCLP